MWLPIYQFPRINRKRLIVLAIYVLILIVVVGGRGWFLARLIDGRYTLSSFLFDATALGLIIILLHLFNYGVKSIARQVFRPTTTLRKLIAHIVHAVIVIIVAGPFIVTTLQIHPQRIVCNSNPQDIGLENYMEVTFYSDGLRLSGWFIPALHKEKPIVLIAHGLGANKDNFLFPALMVHELGYNVFIFDFRAHGNSGGHLTTFGIKEARDVKAAYDWIVKAYPSCPVYALAYSAGGAAVIKAAAEYGIFSKIVLDSTFSRLENVARATTLKRLGPLATPVWQLGRFWGWFWTGVDIDDDRPEKHMALLTNRPVMIIHGTKDTVIPYTESLHLYEATNYRAQLWLVENMQHVQSMNHPDYKTRLHNFFFGTGDTGSGY